MNPGRELDALIDENIFLEMERARNTREVERCHRVIESSPDGVMKPEHIELMKYATNPRGGPGTRAVSPHYSTDIAAAWKLIEEAKRLSSTGFFTLQADDGGGWEAGWMNYIAAQEPQWEQSVVAASAPLAICCALLKAKGIEV